MALDGVLLDLDGTLINSNGVHAEAWGTALEARGYRVGRSRIEEELGKGGDQLVSALLGADAERTDGEALRAEHAKAFTQLALDRGIEPVVGAELLLGELRQRGLRTALATSSRLEHLKVIETASRVRWLELVDVVTHADDVAASKPQPDLVQAALTKLGMGPGQCALIGDTPWDALAGLTAGVVVIGLTYGGNDTASLRRSGARTVCADAAEVLNKLDAVLERASPGSAHLTNAFLESRMRVAFQEAELGLSHGELPIGAVVTDGAGQIVSRAHDRRAETGSIAARAELRALASVAPPLDGTSRGALLLTTLEPGPMVVGAALEAGIDAIVFACPAPPDQGTRRVVPSESGHLQLCRLIGRVLESEGRTLFERWLARPQRRPEHERFVIDLLGTRPEVRAA